MKTLDQMKFELIVERLIMFDGHQGKTSESLEISSRGLRYIISRIKQDDPELYEKIPKYKYVKPYTSGDEYAEKWEREHNYKENE